MKKLKTLISVMLCAMLVLSLVVPAMADNDASTITVVPNPSTDVKQEAGETYTAYKIFNLEYSGNLGVYTLPSDSPFNAEILAEYGLIVSETSVGNDGCPVVEIGDFNNQKAKEFAVFLNDFDFGDYAKKASATTAEQTDNTIKAVIDVSSLGAGYYFVDTTVGSTCIIENVKGDQTVIEDKNTDVTVTKEIVNDDDPEENSVQIGDTVEFKTTIVIPKAAKKVVLHDKMDAGFDFAFTLKNDQDEDVANIQIDGLTLDEEYTINQDPTDECTFEIVFDEDWLKSIEATGATVEVTYSAVLNSDAEVLESQSDNNKNVNETYATFGAGQKSNVDYTYTTTAWFVLNKVIKGTETLLADAKFELYIDGEEEPLALLKSDDGLTYTIADDDDEGTVTEIISKANGKITINGLDEEVTYKLEETEAPTGYNKVLALQDVNEFAETKVENGTGTELPSTGGTGTKILFTVGGIMMVVAFVLFTSKRRMAAED